MSETIGGYLIKRLLGKNSVGVAEKPVIVANGLNGGQYIDDTGTYPGNFIAVQVIADAVFDGATECNIIGLAGSGSTFPAGTILYGNWTLIKLTSGAVVAYG